MTTQAICSCLFNPSSLTRAGPGCVFFFFCIHSVFNSAISITMVRGDTGRTVSFNAFNLYNIFKDAIALVTTVPYFVTCGW